MGKLKPRVSIFQLRGEFPEGEDPRFNLTKVEVIDAGNWFHRQGGNNLRKFKDFNVTRWHKRDGVMIFQKWLFEVSDEAAALLDFQKEIEQQLADMVEKQRNKIAELKKELDDNEFRLVKMAEQLFAFR